jgi:outer membrane protein assembly factor BamD (BamD/ComL family)
MCVAVVALVVAGCHSLPTFAGSGVAQADGKAARAEPEPRDADPAVRQASATEPILPGDPLAPGGIAPGAGVARAGSATHSVTVPADFPESRPASRKTASKDAEDSGFTLESLAPANVYKSLKAAAGYGPNEEVARKAYEEGIELFRQQRYEQAAGKFATAADRWPDSSLEEDALFMLAESYFFSDQYPKALENYEQLLKKHEYSRYLDRAVSREFAIGRYWEKLNEREPHWRITPNFTDKQRPWFDTWGNALKAYEHVRMNDPTGPLADDSIMAAGNAYFLSGRFEDAAFQYDILRKDYPKSEHQLKAHLLAMEAKQQIYQGPMYDGTALKEAGEVADQTLIRFGDSLGRDRDRVVEAKNRIVELRAEREWALGQYWDRKACYAAARIHYQAVIDDFPQTLAAQRAQERLEQIRTFPAEPPNYFKWLEGLQGTKRR